MSLNGVGPVVVLTLERGKRSSTACRVTDFQRDAVRAWRGAVDDWFRHRLRRGTRINPADEFKGEALPMS
jgi:hypothetical protein